MIPFMNIHTMYLLLSRRNLLSYIKHLAMLTDFEFRHETDDSKLKQLLLFVKYM